MFYDSLTCMALHQQDRIVGRPLEPRAGQTGACIISPSRTQVCFVSAIWLIMFSGIGTLVRHRAGRRVQIRRWRGWRLDPTVPACGSVQKSRVFARLRGNSR